MQLTRTELKQLRPLTAHDSHTPHILSAPAGHPLTSKGMEHKSWHLQTAHDEGRHGDKRDSSRSPSCVLSKLALWHRTPKAAVEVQWMLS